MKKFAVIDQKKYDWFEDVFDTEKEALDSAEMQFSHLTEYDKKQREYFAVCECEVDEEGIVDNETLKEIKKYI